MFDKVRMPISLSGAWNFCEDASENHLPLAPDGREGLIWRTAQVPQDVAHTCPERPRADGVFWYQRSISIPAEYANRRVVLRFEAVNYSCAVFVNDRYAGGSEQGFLPFELEITEIVTPGNSHTLSVRVDTRRRPGQLPSSFYWQSCGGIIRDVWLFASDLIHIESAHVDADSAGDVRFSLRLAGDITPDVQACLEIKDHAGTTVARQARAAREACGEWSLHVDDPQLWSPDAPALYAATLSLKLGDRLLDSITTGFGFRTIAVQDGRIALNGQPVFLKGYNRHEDHPQSGGAASRQVVDADFALIKQSGANFIRMCHYPHDSYELEAADRMGLMLLVEIPVNALHISAWGLQNEGAPLHTDEVYLNALDMLQRMIERDRSHPSVIIWSVSNETNEADPGVNDINVALVRTAKRLDPTRLCAHVSMPPYIQCEYTDKLYEHEDIICINMYPTWGGRLNARDRDYPIEKSAAAWRGTVENLNKLYPGKPVLATEFGYLTGNALDGPDAEDVQAECIAREYRALQELVAGASLWHFTDHLWPLPNTISGDLSTFGVLTRNRQPKKALEVYANLLKQTE